MSSGATRSLRAVWGASPTSVFAVGDSGTVLHYDGQSWSAMSIGTNRDIWAVWGSSASDVYVGLPIDSMFHYDGIAWSPVLLPFSGQAGYASIWGSSAGDVFAGNMYYGDIAHFDGNTWSHSYPRVELFTSGKSVLWGSGPTDVFAMGDSLLHYDGQSWSSEIVGTGTYLHRMWGSSPSEHFALGDIGIWHSSGGPWAKMAVPPPYNVPLAGIWGTSATNVYAVGSNGLILRYNGTEWSPTTLAIGGHYRAIWGSSVDDIFVVGSGGVIIHYGP